MTVALKDSAAGVSVAPERLHRCTATVFAEVTIILPISPDSSAGGHPVATTSPGFAPVRVKVNWAHAAWEIAPNESDAEAERNVGVVLAPFALTTHEPDCEEANVTVKVFALVKETDLGSIHKGGVLLSKHVNTTPVEFRLWTRITEVALVKAC